MGLDIYLCKCPDLSVANAAEKAAEEERENAWHFEGRRYEQLSEAEKDSAREKCNEIDAKYGIAEYRHNTIEYLEVDSAIDPNHMFKIGYFRSSYNEGGIERVMRNIGLPTMADIFGAGDEHEFKPDWDASLVKVNSAITGYESHLSCDAGQYLVTEITPMFDRGVQTQKEALDMFIEEMNRYKGSDFTSYSNGNGEFILGGMNVRALITKKYTPSQSGDILGRILNRQSIFAVYDKPKPEDGKEDWYLTALKIVRESIEYVLAQPDKQHFFLSWSS